MKNYLNKLQSVSMITFMKQMLHALTYLVALSLITTIPFSIISSALKIDLTKEIFWFLEFKHVMAVTYIIIFIYTGFIKFDLLDVDKQFKNTKKYYNVPLVKKIAITFTFAGVISSLLLFLFLINAEQLGVVLTTMDIFSVFGLIFGVLSVFYSIYSNLLADLQKYDPNSSGNTIENIARNNMDIKLSLIRIESKTRANPRNKRKISNR
ncbi:hypothetical protein MUN88_17010 [Gracilibacillus caseinilyticus]|uniref:Uncharacterized protein n=1 Tax=Gracilibacillus caseinilyticus TaxID=2932256 RepID=A0ABY4EV78_9BACI|nr:hypothetical protein [Gracilibacillus caseinilyticus]UOQ47732.1 hypothetical protein MUN88_17010 [Gracilibacillus caseinilyticus]